MAVPRALQPLVDAPARAALFVDFDGSLAPIVLDPAAATALPAARAALARLAPHLGLVAVVSGRPASFLRDALALDRVQYVGTYGLERIVDGEVVLDERARPYLDAIARAADDAEAALPGLRVERKGDVAVTVHWRDQPERGEAAARWASEAAPRLGLEAPLRGRMAVELRPPVPVDKGTVVTGLARGMHAAAFAGDDVGDLPAFAALQGLVDRGELAHAASIGVASVESPPDVHAADVVVDGPAGLAALLDALADALADSTTGSG
jgi:trehalose 6-phosphate phosphatase